MAQFYQNTVNRLDPRPQNASVPWILHPVDMKTTVRENDRSQLTAASSSKPEPNLSTTRPSVSASVPVDLPNISYAVLKSLLANISQDQNMTSSKEGTNGGLVPPSPNPEPIAMETSSSIENMVKMQLEEESSEKMNRRNVKNESKIETEDEAKRFMRLVYKFPHLYNTEDSAYRNEEKKAKSWAVISEIFNMTDHDCRRRWEVLRDKYSAEMKQLTISAGCASKKSTQFINKTNLPPHQKAASAQRNEASGKEEHRSVRPSEKRKRSKSPSRSVSSSKKLNKSMSRSRSTIPSRKLLESESPSRNHSRRPDQSFVDDIALELQRFSPRQKILVKAKIWQVLVEFGNPV